MSPSWKFTAFSNENMYLINASSVKPAKFIYSFSETYVSFNTLHTIDWDYIFFLFLFFFFFVCVSWREKGKEFPDMLLISSHTAGQMAKNAKTAAWDLYSIVGGKEFCFGMSFSLIICSSNLNMSQRVKQYQPNFKKFLSVSALKQNASGPSAW